MSFSQLGLLKYISLNKSRTPSNSSRGCGRAGLWFAVHKLDKPDYVDILVETIFYFQLLIKNGWDESRQTITPKEALWKLTTRNGIITHLIVV